ncbi:MerR family transcriptional regulator [Aquimarina aggregata]|uniref:MerR family transcriptional regulator n=1 Tax=Aquimarina aggregata TaxID=1642818 RepID=UPI0024906F3F|nr:MerR family transcriptional regulator [Aquimarina aggregata]
MKSNQLDFKPHSTALNEMIFEAKDLHGITIRTLHSWRQSGVLDDKRDPNALRRWNYFSPIDIVWIGILKELKQLRFSHIEMKACKKVLFELITAEDNKEYPALEYYTFLILLYNQPVYIIISYDKGIDAIWMLDEKDYFLKLRAGEIENHTALSLHKAVKINLHPVYKLPDFSATAGLTDDEIKILQIIKNKTFKTIKVTKRNGDVDSIEGIERIENLDKIEKLIKSGNYQNMAIKQHNGKIVSAQRTIRTNFTRK